MELSSVWLVVDVKLPMSLTLPAAPEPGVIVISLTERVSMLWLTTSAKPAKKVPDKDELLKGPAACGSNDPTSTPGAASISRPVLGAVR
jgi:hypothetical protein